jgi:hypothetical protein
MEEKSFSDIHLTKDQYPKYRELKNTKRTNNPINELANEQFSKEV